MSDPADIEYQRRVEDDIEAVTVGLEVAVLAVIARRLGKLEGTSYVDVYASMPADISAIDETINKGIKRIQDVTNEAMNSMATANDGWAKAYYEAAGRDQVPASDHFLMKAKLREKTSEATKYINAACRSSVIEIINDKTSETMSIKAAYERVVSRTATQMASGALTGEQAVSQAVRELSKSGLRVRYASGATRNLYSAVSTNVMDSYRTAMSDLREIQGREFGADGVEVTAHAESAPDHLPYQGRQYSYERRRGYQMWDEVQNEPARPLVTGANCGHSIFPVILGISSQKYTEAQLRDMERRSNELVTITGLSGQKLTMTRYEATQYQRRVETSIRKMNENAYLLKQADLPNFAKMERQNVKARTAKYKRLSSEAGLGTRMERTRAYVI